MASGHAPAGVALRPVMDLSDSRVVAYRASPRWAGERPHPAALLAAALSRAATVAPASLLVRLEPSLLVDLLFDAVAVARESGCNPGDVVFLLPDPRREPAGRIAARRRYAARLAESGHRVGLEGVNPLSLAWEDVVEAQPAFLVVDPSVVKALADEPAQAALAGLLAFAGRLGARLVAEGVDDADTARTLLDVGVFYGAGDHLHCPVVLEPGLASEGDLVVRPSWFKERAVRQLTSGAHEPEPPVHFVAAPPRQHVIDDRRLPGLLAEWSGELAAAGDVGAVLEALADIVPRLVEVDRIAIFEADWDRYVLRPRVLVGESLQSLRDVSYTLNIGITGWAFLQGEPYRCGRTAEHPEGAPIRDQVDQDESMIVVPLVSGGERLGVLDLWRDGADRFSEYELERAALLGKLGADAWSAASDRAELAERVVTDTVTGLLNKRWWEELAPREAAQALRADTGIGVLLVDLDGFKRVNDSGGHASGDALLKQVAQTLSAAVRSGDAVVRYGGDEFVLLLRDCDEKGAFEVATEVQLALARRLPLKHSDVPVTASIGIALFPLHGPTLDDVVARADAAMYRAKALGRDQIALYSAMPVHGDGEASGAPTAGEAREHRHEVGGGHEAPLAGEIAGVPASPPPSPGAPEGTDLEDQLRHLDEAQHLARLGSYEMDLATGAIEWSGELRRIIGVPADAVPSVGLVVDRIHPDHHGDYAEAMRRFAEDGQSPVELRLRLSLPGGEVVEALLTQSARQLPDGRRVLTGTLQELSRRDAAGPGAGAAHPLCPETPRPER